jgi:hypothetical protein
VVIGGLRQRSDVGNFNGIPYLKDLHVVGRLFRSRDTDVRESELVVFISPEIISYSDEPNCRQKLAEDTVRCRLDQIPQGEGCPPCCRRLPSEVFEEDVPAPEAADQHAGDKLTPSIGHEDAGPKIQANADDFSNLKQPDSLEPLSANRIPSAEFQFGAAGRNELVRYLVAEGRLRRLPAIAIETSIATAGRPAGGLFAAPPAVQTALGPAENPQVRMADRYEALPTYR